MRNSTGPFDVSLIDAAIASITGDRNTSEAPATTMSKLRFSTKSSPSKTGGFSSNSGTDWPGTSSWRWVMISIVVGAIRTATPRS